MKSLPMLLIIFILATGCYSPVKYARAEKIREQTRQSRELHNQRMADNQASAEARIMVKVAGLYIGIVAASIGLGIGLYAFGVFMIGSVKAAVNERSIVIIEDPQHRRFPVFIKDNFVMNLSTGERFLIGDVRQPNPMLVESSKQVQLAAGNRQKIINAKLLTN